MLVLAVANIHEFFLYAKGCSELYLLVHLILITLQYSGHYIICIYKWGNGNKTENGETWFQTKVIVRSLWVGVSSGISNLCHCVIHV